MKKRFFAFGCSYTSWEHETWADFIGASFSQYYNFGQAGSCNTFIMHKMLETNERYGFNSDTDVIIVGLTGFGRFTYLEQDNQTMQYNWKTNGDILFKNPDHPDKAKWVANNLYNFRWAVHNSWIALKVMKNFLQTKNIEHKFFMALDNTHYQTEKNTLELTEVYGDPKFLHIKINQLFNMMDIKESIEDYRRYRINILKLDETTLHHPTKQVHYDYAQRHFPEYITEKSKEVLYREKMIYGEKRK